ncbi:MAG: hypothetical protein R2911_13355 [Caldilineaceae bacterium]
MSTQVLLELPDETYQRASQLARLTSRGVTDVLTDVLSLSLPLLDEGSSAASAIDTLSDREILQLTELQMHSDEDTRLSELLDQQQAGAISEIERMELANLMRIYQVGLLRKAQALAEAVHRGLRPPLSP